VIPSITPGELAGRLTISFIVTNRTAVLRGAKSGGQVESRPGGWGEIHGHHGNVCHFGAVENLYITGVAREPRVYGTNSEMVVSGYVAPFDHNNSVYTPAFATLVPRFTEMLKLAPPPVQELAITAYGGRLT
jgi:hypothetical protein